MKFTASCVSFYAMEMISMIGFVPTNFHSELVVDDILATTERGTNSNRSNLKKVLRKKYLNG